ncbi:MAG: ATP-binding cassette domain-containing protein, partial [Deltaproteobacteria bacterium]|nr:ATP-binding cassette domain-containing protein [Deltaproteobacteria bacterium]
MSGNNDLLKVIDVSLHFGGVAALKDVSITVGQSEILAIIGPNGAGKSCLLNCINGFYRPQKGQIYFQGQDITRLKSHKIASLGVGRTFQGIQVFSGLSTVDNLLTGRHLHMKTNIFL